jgi:hypothetical protein
MALIRNGRGIVRLLVGFLVLVVFAGCETVGERMRSKFGPVPSQSASYAAEPERVYEAARTVVTQMGFRILRGNASRGRLEAVSSVRTDDHFRGSRQLELKLAIKSGEEGGSLVQVILMELIEDDSAKTTGMGMASPLRDTGIHQALLRELRQALGEAEKS